MTCYRCDNTFICMAPPIIKLRPSVWLEWHEYMGPTFYYDRHGVREITNWWRRKHVYEAFEKWLRKENAKVIDGAFEKYKTENDLKVFRSPKVVQALRHELELNIKEMREIYKKGFHKKYIEEPEMYQDAVTPEAIADKLEYVSDRWNCAGRIKFLLRIALEGL